MRKYNGKLLIKPSKANVAAFLKKIRATIKKMGAIKQEALIGLLNPMIRGWANYHQHVVSKATFARVDCEIWRALWRWASRRHQKKRRRWIKERYFHSVGTRQWVFAAETETRLSNGRHLLRILQRASDIPIKRHRKIKGDANPFDPQWEVYFEERKSQKMLNSLQGRRKLIGLWYEQDRRCPICQELITKAMGWHVHHLVRRVDGGKDGSTNLVMVHPNCHNKIHAAGLKVVKPVRENGL